MVPQEKFEKLLGPVKPKKICPIFQLRCQRKIKKTIILLTWPLDTLQKTQNTN